MKLRGALTLAKASFLEASAFRLYFLFTIISNFFYMILIYFLWKAIFSSVETVTINGMTFQQTFIYLALAGCISTVMMTYAEWTISRDVRDGTIVMMLIKPMDYQAIVLSKHLGDIFTNFLIIFLPSFVVVWALAGDGLVVGINLVFFLIAFVFAAAINLIFDFMIGLFAFYTESVWGISTMKDVIVTLLAGAAIPLAFFPDGLRRIVEWLPFQAIYNLPLQILVNNSLRTTDFLIILAKQLFWLVFLLGVSRLCFNKAKTAVTINGG